MPEEKQKHDLVEYIPAEQALAEMQAREDLHMERVRRDRERSRRMPRLRRS